MITEEQILHHVGLINTNPEESKIATGLAIKKLKKDIYTFFDTNKQDYFYKYLQFGVDTGRLDKRLLNFYHPKLNDHLVKHAKDRNKLLDYIGFKTLYDRYLLRHDDNVIELVQTFFMRVAMGLAIADAESVTLKGEASDYNMATDAAILYYDEISMMRYMPSTPTLFNSGTVSPQLSSCFVSTINDSLESIYSQLKNNAHISKFSGGIGVDWSNVRSANTPISSTGGNSQGIVPFMKVYNDTLVAVNQGGKRRGAGVAYIEPWHADIYEFLQVRKSTGDERLRCHDMNTALWVPDLFMERVKKNNPWHLFNPQDVPHLHKLYGNKFKQAYKNAESNPNIKKKRVNARDLFKQILSMLFETGHPWITYKDKFNIRNPQAHCGTINSSNLCTEIGLNTSKHEIAVCNLGSLNLTKFILKNESGHVGIDEAQLKQTVSLAIRMLNNVIDLNYHVVEEAEVSNKKHRAIGLGAMGFATALRQHLIPFQSVKTEALNKILSEKIQYFAMLESNRLAKKYGPYDSFGGSTWSRGLLTHDTFNSDKNTFKHKDVINTETYVTNREYKDLRHNIMKYGLRNSNLTSVAPTATIANICGVSQSYEPVYSNVFAKNNLNGEFTIIDKPLIQFLKDKDRLSEDTISELQTTQGVYKGDLEEVFTTSFETDQEFLIKLAAQRQRFIDQSQSLNLYFNGSDGDKLYDIYMHSFDYGLKSTYYLRTRAATTIEVQTTCSIDNPECEACQ